MWLPLRWLPALSLVFLALSAGAAAEEPAEPLSFVLVRQGPNPGDEARAVLFEDGQLTLTATRVLGSLQERFECATRLPARAAAALRADLAAIRPFDLPPLEDPPESGAPPQTSLELKLGGRKFSRAWVLRHLQGSLPDAALVRCLELYTGLRVRAATHLMKVADTWFAQKVPAYAIHFGRMAVHTMDKPWPDGFPELPDDPVGQRLTQASDLEKHGDLRKAHELHRAILADLQAGYARWVASRDLTGELAPATPAPK